MKAHSFLQLDVTLQIFLFGVLSALSLLIPLMALSLLGIEGRILGGFCLLSSLSYAIGRQRPALLGFIFFFLLFAVQSKGFAPFFLALFSIGGGVALFSWQGVVSRIERLKGQNLADFAKVRQEALHGRQANAFLRKKYGAQKERAALLEQSLEHQLLSFQALEEKAAFWQADAEKSQEKVSYFLGQELFWQSQLEEKDHLYRSIRKRFLDQESLLIKMQAELSHEQVSKRSIEESLANALAQVELEKHSAESLKEKTWQAQDLAQQLQEARQSLSALQAHLEDQQAASFIWQDLLAQSERARSKIEQALEEKAAELQLMKQALPVEQTPPAEPQEVISQVRLKLNGEGESSGELRRMQGLYRQLKEQFEEKRLSLDEARKALFQATEQAEALKREMQEEEAFHRIASAFEKDSIRLRQELEQELSFVQNENESLQELIAALFEESRQQAKKSDSRAPLSRISYKEAAFC
ncbi:MAG: hypothetical protein K0S07_1407 [Chlamydiales bacterium]|nr:hypothetical protein [Chlamydiales bacterium]